MIDSSSGKRSSAEARRVAPPDRPPQGDAFQGGIPLDGIPLACPIDGLPLTLAGRTFACERRHAYDLSRHGHVNLLPVQFKPSRSPGDDAAMVAARRRVLDAGLFDPLADALAERVAECAATVSDEAPLLVDAGCGEGFYTHRMAERLAARESTRAVRVLGSDISAPAVLAAVKRHRDLGWCVANNTRLPLLSGRVGVITSLFGFETWAPWSALQGDGRWVVVVRAGPRHLIELREAIYARVRVHEVPSDAAAIEAGYERIDERRIVFANEGVTGERLADVLAMTPHAHRVGGPGRGEIADAPAGDLTVDAVLRVYRRRLRGPPGLSR